MINLQDPLITELRRRGYKIAAHAYVHPRKDGVQVLLQAHHPETMHKIDARSRVDLDDALVELRNRCELAGIVPEDSDSRCDRAAETPVDAPGPGAEVPVEALGRPRHHRSRSLIQHQRTEDASTAKG